MEINAAAVDTLYDLKNSGTPIDGKQHYITTTSATTKNGEYQ